MIASYLYVFITGYDIATSYIQQSNFDVFGVIISFHMVFGKNHVACNLILRCMTGNEKIYFQPYKVLATLLPYCHILDA